MLEDNGAIEKFIMHKITKKLELEINLTVVFKRVNGGEFRQQEMFIYLLEMLDTKRVSHQAKATGLDSITDVGHMKGVPKLWHSFPTEP